MQGDRGWKVDSLLRGHLLRYPLMEPVDLYKLLFQAVMGPAHAMADHGAARVWLLSELERPGPGPEEPLLDPIAGAGGITRVHLRPWLAAGLDPDLLLEAFVRTSETFLGSVPQLEAACLEAAAFLHGEHAAPAAEGFERMVPSLREHSFPALHHSAAYRVAYRPAYRVVDASLLAPEVISAVRH
jgi:hypothetical protein